MAHASDGLGSIRIPAACCGLVGLKVTRDRCPVGPDTNEDILGQSVNHVVSRTVRDTAAMLDVTGFPFAGTPFAVPPRPESYLAEVGKSPGKLKIWWSSETPRGRGIDPEIQAALEAIAVRLAELGHEVTPRGLGIDYLGLYNARLASNGANFAATIAKWIEHVGREPEGDDFETLTWVSYKSGRKATGADAFAALGETRARAREVVKLWDEMDVYLCPVLGTPPSPLGWIDTQNTEPRELNKRQAAAYPYTPIFNFTGQPAISLPLAWTESGLPLGMMFVGRYGDEATLLRLAAQLEKEMPWKDRRPPVW
jgi:amidase